MFSLSQTTGYAIKALVCLAGGYEVRQVRDIAGCTDTPVHYLAKVVHRLAGAGILESKRGHKGGVWLVRKPEEISLLEISEAVDGRARFGSCLLGFDNCSDERACPTHKFWKAARAEIRRQLASISLADVLEFEKRRARKGACSALTPQPTTR